MVIRVLAGALFVAAVLLQAQLWFSADGFREVSRLDGLIAAQRAENGELALRNQQLEDEVRQLQAVAGAVEERARTDLGLIGRAETFYLFGSPVEPAQPSRPAAR
jgi:cell division protein FtsB